MFESASGRLGRRGSIQVVGQVFNLLGLLPIRPFIEIGELVRLIRPNLEGRLIASELPPHRSLFSFKAVGGLLILWFLLGAASAMISADRGHQRFPSAPAVAEIRRNSVGAFERKSFLKTACIFW